MEVKMNISSKVKRLSVFVLLLLIPLIFFQTHAFASKIFIEDLKLTTDTNDQSQPDVAYDTINNRYFVVWTDSRNPSGTDIYGRFIQLGTASGATSTTLTDASKNWTVNELAGQKIMIKAGTGIGQERTILSNTANTITVATAWTVTPDTTSQYAILGNEFVISNAAGDQSQPKVAFDDMNTPNRYLVVWTDTRSGVGRIYGQFVGVDGTLDVKGNFQISQSVDVLDSNPAVTADSSGTITAIATDASDNTTTITDNTKSWVSQKWKNYAIHFISGTAAGQSAVVLSSDSKTLTIPSMSTLPAVGDTYRIKRYLTPITYQSQSVPSVIFNRTTKSFTVAWLDRTDYEQKYIYSVRKICGIDNSHQYFSYFPPTVADTNMVRFREVSYNGVNTSAPQQDGSNLTSSISNWSKFYYIGQGFTPSESCSKTKASLTVNGTLSTMNYESAPVITYNPTDGSHYVVWSGRGFTVNSTVNWSSDCKIELKDIQGNVIGCAEWWPFVQTGPTYTVEPDKVPVIYGRNITLGLVKDTVLSDTTKSSYNPAIAFDPFKNMWLATWETQDDACGDPQKDTCKNIYGQLIDMQNYLQYGSVISISKAPSDQTESKVAFDTVNQRYLVVWDDGRSSSASISNMDIFGQFIDPTGRPSGANFPITVAPGNQISPALSFGDVDSRRFFIAWKDGRVSGDADIYGQAWSYSVAPQLLVTDENNVQIYNQALDFGNVDVKLTSTKKFRIWNNGNSQLTIYSISTPDEPFTLITPKATTISPGVYYEMEVKFAPMAGGSYSGNASNNYKIEISSDGGSIVIYLSGNGDHTVPLNVTTASLPDAGRGVAYSQKLTAEGGTAPYVWSISSGSLPAGLSLDVKTGIISGTPTLTATDASFTVMVKDTNGDPTGTSATRNLSIKVTSMAVTTAGLNQWTQGVAGYAETLAATGGTPPYTWTLIGGTLPAGLSLNAAGNITGTPTDAGSQSFTVRVSDSGFPALTATKEFTIVVNPAPAILTTSLPSTVVSASYSTAIVVAGGTSPLNWTKISGSLPPGISLNGGSGQLAGTPSSSGSYTFTVEVKDKIQSEKGVSGVSKSFTITVNDIVNITTTSTTAASKGSYYSQTISTSLTGLPPYTWSIVQGTLPDGLTLNTSTGVISGTPTSSGTYYFTAQVQDAVGTKSQKTLSIQVADASASGTTGGTTTTTTAAGGGGGGGGGGCFIATAAYGSYLHPHVMVLKEFRDKVLLKSSMGQVFVRIYYRYSPPVAHFIGNHNSIKYLTRLAITPLVFALKYPHISLILFGFSVLFGYIAIRRCRF
ncbi:MAG: putative Ig domain-containing protein [Syntrophorhabdaceae bacterium]|nr:putative Ig domain-containing protein [Syntrophorhabdaceae bacterium]